MAEERWSLQGDYFENCNCEVLCPCVVQGGPVIPTEGHCDVAFAFHIEEGDYNGITLNGLNFVVAVYTPGNMGEGNWTMAAYVDRQADSDQREAIARILSGDVGGPAGRWMPLTTNFLGIKYSPITYEAQGHTRRVSIPEIIDFSVEGIVVGSQSEPMRLTNTGHPVNRDLYLAKGTASTYTDHGMSWDNTSKNGHFSQFDWHWP